MGKKKSAPRPDYGSLWKTFDRWQQEDRMWYEREKATQERGADIASEKARMSAAGLSAGSKAWQERLAKVKAKRPDIEAQYAQKQQELQQSMVYKDLQKEFQKQETKRRETEMGAHMKGIEKEIRSAMDFESFGSKPKPMTREREAELRKAAGIGHTKAAMIMEDDPGLRDLAGRFAEREWGGYSKYAAGIAERTGFQFQGKSFEDWGRERFGTQQAANPYAEKGPTAAEKATRRAQKAASGRRQAAVGAQVVGSQAEENPWL